MYVYHKIIDNRGSYKSTQTLQIRVSNAENVQEPVSVGGRGRGVIVLFFFSFFFGAGIFINCLKFSQNSDFSQNSQKEKSGLVDESELRDSTPYFGGKSECFKRRI